MGCSLEVPDKGNLSHRVTRCRAAQIQCTKMAATHGPHMDDSSDHLETRLDCNPEQVEMSDDCVEGPVRIIPEKISHKCIGALSSCTLSMMYQYRYPQLYQSSSLLRQISMLFRESWKFRREERNLQRCHKGKD